jgi:hypothetical protein
LSYQNSLQVTNFEAAALANLLMSHQLRTQFCVIRGSDSSRPKVVLQPPETGARRWKNILQSQSDHARPFLYQSFSPTTLSLSSQHKGPKELSPSGCERNTPLFVQTRSLNANLYMRVRSFDSERHSRKKSRANAEHATDRDRHLIHSSQFKDAHMSAATHHRILARRKCVGVELFALARMCK